MSRSRIKKLVQEEKLSFERTYLAETTEIIISAEYEFPENKIPEKE